MGVNKLTRLIVGALAAISILVNCKPKETEAQLHDRMIDSLARLKPPMKIKSEYSAEEEEIRNILSAEWVEITEGENDLHVSDLRESAGKLPTHANFFSSSRTISFNEKIITTSSFGCNYPVMQ